MSTVAKLLFFTASTFLIGAVGIHRANLRSTPEKRRERWIKLGGYFAVVHGVLLCAWLGRAALAALFLLVVVAGGRELVRARAHALTLTSYAALGACLIGFVLRAAPQTTIYVYLVVAAFDGFSQVTGESLGHHRLAPRVSPQKTVEGALGGLVAAIFTGLVLRPLPDLDWLPATAASGLASAAALGGDLTASWVKRRSGIKDFGDLLPGPGGILDRFDSFLAAGACALFLSRTAP